MSLSDFYRYHPIEMSNLYIMVCIIHFKSVFQKQEFVFRNFPYQDFNQPFS